MTASSDDRVAAGRPPAIETVSRRTPVEAYWTEHTVNSRPFAGVEDSENYLEWRFAQYPLFREFMQMWDGHAGEVVVDYGCGPGDDVIGFLAHSGAARVIGMDVSPTALRLTGARVGLYNIPPTRVALLQLSDARPAIPLRNGAVDFINCGGVLHHTSHPELILAEFRRVLRPAGRATIMVYNTDSVWVHLYTAYIKQVVEGAFSGLTLDEAFTCNTDGEACPISRHYRGAEFCAIAESAGFRAEYVGGYLSAWELRCLDDYGQPAIEDQRLDDEHRAFLRELERDARGYPVYHGKHAGIGGVYRLTRD